MVKKEYKSPEDLYWPAKLIIPINEFKECLKLRIKIGYDLHNTSVENKQKLEGLKNEFNKRNEYNIEYLKVKFNYQENRYFYDYNSSVYAILYNIDLFEEINHFKEDIKDKICILEALLGKADLIPVLEQPVEKIEKDNETKKIIQIMKWFNKFVQELRYRHNNRETIIINDEYDIQDLLRSLLKIFYNDVRHEDFAPSNAWWNSRIDLVLHDEKIIIEIKMASEKLKDKDIWEQILIDIWRYHNHPSYKTLIVFIYDKWDNIRNKQWLIKDLQKQSKNWKEIIVIINPD